MLDLIEKYSKPSPIWYIHIPKFNYLLANTEYLCFLRYPFDIYDRIWGPYSDNTYTILSTFQTIDTSSNNYYQPPSIVMSNASTPINVSAPLELFWDTENATSEYYIYMHFAEVVNLTATQFRSFNITLNGKYWYRPFAPKYLSTITLFSPSILPNAQKYDFLFFKAEGSTLPPIINALEIYSVRDLSQSGTYQKDGMFSSTHVNLVPGSIIIIIILFFDLLGWIWKCYSWCDHKYQVSIWSTEKLGRRSVSPTSILMGWFKL